MRMSENARTGLTVGSFVAVYFLARQATSLRAKVGAGVAGIFGAWNSLDLQATRPVNQLEGIVSDLKLEVPEELPDLGISPQEWQKAHLEVEAQGIKDTLKDSRVLTSYLAIRHKLLRLVKIESPNIECFKDIADAKRKRDHLTLRVEDFRLIVGAIIGLDKFKKLPELEKFSWGDTIPYDKITKSVMRGTIDNKPFVVIKLTNDKHENWIAACVETSPEPNANRWEGLLQQSQLVLNENDFHAVYGHFSDGNIDT